MDLRDYHGKRIGVFVNVGGVEKLIVGNAAYGDDPTLGNVLRIALNDTDFAEQSLEILIAESTWSGVILTGTNHGCDFVFRAS